MSNSKLLDQSVFWNIGARGLPIEAVKPKLEIPISTIHDMNTIEVLSPRESWGCVLQHELYLNALELAG